ncbi:amidohydrolase family protein [Altererythrobacter sp. Z27]|uniref:amidohydrolase family protein n=1 Tax=Altererythrobacter sp. Z27 TaxID=3461147 RepID=UPI0040441132
MPPNACDSHIHILDPRFPARPGWPGSPVNDATVAAYREFQQRIGTSRTVVVTPSTYGIDNGATLNALRKFAGSARGIAVIDCDAPPSNLAELAEAGVVGLRVNFVSPQSWGKTDVRRLHRTARIAADMGWQIQVYARGADIAEMESELASLPVPLVIDHLGYVTPGDLAVPAGLDSVIRLLKNGRTWVKLSGPYISSVTGLQDYADLMPIARSYVDAASERLVWGSDWPHRGQSANWPDDARLADLLLEWVPDESQRQAVLVDNPARLYGFT